jgi:hypothetical protein
MRIPGRGAIVEDADLGRDMRNAWRKRAPTSAGSRRMSAVSIAAIMLTSGGISSR